MMMPTDNEKRFLERFLGKRVSLVHKGKIICGELTFLGLNEFLPSWNIQATIGRMPIRDIDITKLKVLEEGVTRKDI